MSLKTCFILIIFLILNEDWICVFISKSDIQICNNFLQNKSANSTQNQNLNCTKKLVLSLSIENGKMEDTDSIEAYVTEVTNVDGEVKQLVNPFKLQISKTPVYAIYPTIYFQDFNYRPTEQIVISDIFSCTDGDLASDPTCGWAYTNSNQKTSISYSQGFCCKCDFSQIIGIDNTNRNRGSSCDLLNLGKGSATAHCLRYDKLWYSAYEVKQYQINYDINIFIIKKLENNTFSTESIALNPSNTVSISQNKTIIGRLIGDFQPPTPPLDFTQNYLTIPVFPSTHTMVLEGPLNWMLIPKSMFSSDGRDCDRIGVSYYAFRSQSNQCKMKIGDCLNNQIYNLYMDDLQLILAGKWPKYLLSQNKDLVYSFYENKQFGYKLNGVFNSLITLEIIADDIKFVINVSQGIIDYVKIQTFEAKSNDGLLEAQITNSGNMTAQFSVSFNCSQYVLPILSSDFSLKPFESYKISKNIYSLNQDSRQHICNITLKNSIGDITDSKSSYFYTTNTIIKNNQSPNETNENNTNYDSNITPDYISLECKTLCPGFFDFLCFVAHSCWGFFFRTIGVMIILLLLLIFIYKSFRNKLWCRLIDKITKKSEKEKSSPKFEKEFLKNEIYYDKQMFINFDNSIFDFTSVNLCSCFSIPVILTYNVVNNDDSIYNIKSIKFQGKFKQIIDSNFNEEFKLDLVIRMINENSNFMTEFPLFSIIN